MQLQNSFANRNGAKSNTHLRLGEMHYPRFNDILIDLFI